MSEDRRRYLKEMLDEIDRYFEDFEKGIEEVLRSNFGNVGDDFFSRSIVTGMAFGMSPEGKPSVRFFGNDPRTGDDARSPIYEQVVDEKAGRLRLMVELPGVEKQDVQLSAVDTTVSLAAENGERKYKVEIPLERAVDPESGAATYRNGLLDVVFTLREKTNKGYRRVSVV